MALPLAGVLASAISAVLALKAVSLVISLGFAYGAYTGLDTFVDWIKVQVQTEIAGAGTTVVEVLSVLNLDRSLNIIFAAYLTRLVFVGMRGGTVRRWFSANPIS